MSSSQHRYSSQIFHSLFGSLKPLQRACALICTITLLVSILVACNAQNIATYLESSDLFNTIKLPNNAGVQHQDAHAIDSSIQESTTVADDGSSSENASSSESTASTDNPSNAQTSDTASSNTQTTESSHQSAATPFTSDQSISSKPSTDASTQTESDHQITVHVLVECSQAVNAGWRGQSVMFEDDISIDEGMTALDVTQQVVAVSVVYSQFGAYVRAIDSLSEKQFGSQSGWVYSVNGVEPQHSAGNHVLHNHDKLTWSYVTKPSKKK